MDEVESADITDLGADRGHQVLTVPGKGNRRAKVPLSPATLQAVHAYLDHRAARAGLDGWRGMARPLLATSAGGQMRPRQLWELVRRLAAAAGIVEWERLSAHSLRHTAITSLEMSGVASGATFGGSGDRVMTWTCGVWPAVARERRAERHAV